MSATEIEMGINQLFRTQYPQTADVGIFPVHVICKDDDLEHIGMNSFAGARDPAECCHWS